MTSLPEGRRPTLSFIARKAGVSKSLVSAILNPSTKTTVRISSARRKEVLALIDRYGYVPRKSARELASRTTDTIGIIMHRLTPCFAALTEHLQQEALRRGFDIMPYLTHGSGEREEEYLEAMRDGRVDGVITAAMTDGSRERYRRFSLPPYNLRIVTINRPVDGVPSVHFDDEAAGRLAAEHLEGIGCSSFCALGGDESHPRVRGFLERVRTAGWTAANVPSDGAEDTFATGRRLARRVVGGRPAGGRVPDGVFAFNDLIAAGFIAEAVRAGLRVPGDVAVVGCDDTEVCDCVTPGLTSVATNAAATAAVAVERLASLIAGRAGEPVHTMVPVALTVRDSTRRASVFPRDAAEAVLVKQGGGA